MKTRIGIIGCGSIVQRAYLPGFSEPDSVLAARAMQGHFHNGCEDAEVVAIADLNIELANSLAKEYSIPAVYSDWHQVITNSEVDAVCVATPNVFHAEMVLAALNAEKHVLVEKPMATSWADVKAMVDLANAKKKVLMVNHSFRFSPIFEKAREIIDSGLLGNIFSIRGRFSYAGPEHWTGSAKTWFLDKSMAGGGALFDAGIHAVDLIRFLIGKEAVRVGSFLCTLEKDIEAEDNALSIIRFADGTLGSLEASWTTKPGEIFMNVYGSEGNMTVDMGEGSATISGPDASPITVIFAPPKTTYMNMKMPAGRLKIPLYLPEIETKSKLGGPYRHFMHCIQTGAFPITSGNDALKSMEILFASYISNEKGQIITLPLD